MIQPAMEKYVAPLVVSARLADNAEMFPDVLSLHVRQGAIVADVTHGRGVFWRKVDRSKYKLLATDISTGVDCRRLPYRDRSVDAIVLDPPYMESGSNTAYSRCRETFRFSQNYGLNTVSNGSRYRGAILDLYLQACVEADRVLKSDGVLIVKCQDEVCANQQRLTHVQIINGLADRWRCKDLFVTVRKSRPIVSRLKKQVHARKNHSYFLVFVRRLAK